MGMVSPGAAAAAAARLTTRSATARLLFAAPFVLAGLAAVLLVPDAGAQTEPPPAPRDARQIFLADCATCHGADAKGTNRGPSLERVGRASLDYYLTTGRMPITNPDLFLANPDQEIKRQKPAYPPATIGALEDYIQGLTGPAIAPGGN